MCFFLNKSRILGWSHIILLYNPVWSHTAVRAETILGSFSKPDAVDARDPRNVMTMRAWNESYVSSTCFSSSVLFPQTYGITIVHTHKGRSTFIKYTSKFGEYNYSHIGQSYSYQKIFLLVEFVCTVYICLFSKNEHLWFQKLKHHTV